MAEVTAGTIVYIVDQIGATFAFIDEFEANLFALEEFLGGAEEVVQCSYLADKDMSYYDAAEYALTLEIV